MNLLLGSNIKRIRLDRGLTQEEVAAHLGISFQSISKWERNDGYPDITMLPSLARYFQITIDELLGMNELEKEDHYNRINQLWIENNATGNHPDNVNLMRQSLKEFPNDALLLVQLSTSLEKLEGTEAEKLEHLKESITVQEQILRHGEDSAVRSATLFNICFAYWKVGDHNKAIEQAEKLPNLYKARENALVYFLSGQEKHDAAKAALEPLAWAIDLHLKTLAETENNPEYLSKAEQIQKLLLG